MTEIWYILLTNNETDVTTYDFYVVYERNTLWIGNGHLFCVVYLCMLHCFMWIVYCIRICNCHVNPAGYSIYVNNDVEVLCLAASFWNSNAHTLLCFYLCSLWQLLTSLFMERITFILLIIWWRNIKTRVNWPRSK